MYRAILLLAAVAALVFPVAALSAPVQPPAVLYSNQGMYMSTPTLIFAMWSFDDLSDGVADIYVAVRSRTDMPVPNVFVYLATCAEGQQTPLMLGGKVRHMDGKQETLHAYASGRLWEWEPFSAPANTDSWLVLRMPLKVSTLGPLFCVQGLAGSAYDQGQNAVFERSWYVK